MNIKNKINNWFFPDLSIPRGNYHATKFTVENEPYKLFLMVDGQGLGTLIINASTIVNLNQTSTDLLYHYVRDESMDRTLWFMGKKYTQPKQAVQLDYERLLDEIESFIGLEDQAPRSAISGEDIEEENSGTVHWHIDRASQLHEWEKKLDHAVEDGIPHFVFAGEDILHIDWLKELIEYTETLGVVAGLATKCGLSDKAIITDLLRVGLDHIVLMVDQPEDIDHEFVKWLSDGDVYIEIQFSNTFPKTEIQSATKELRKFNVHGFMVDSDIGSPS